MSTPEELDVIRRMWEVYGPPPGPSFWCHIQWHMYGSLTSYETRSRISYCMDCGKVKA